MLRDKSIPSKLIRIEEPVEAYVIFTSGLQNPFFNPTIVCENLFVNHHRGLSKSKKYVEKISRDLDEATAFYWQN